MWPFKAKPTNSEVLERLESLERRFKTLLLDVQDFFDSVRRAENRMKTKAAKIEAAEVIEDLTPATPDPLAHLTPKQREIQQQVLRRRGGIQ